MRKVFCACVGIAGLALAVPAAATTRVVGVEEVLAAPPDLAPVKTILPRLPAPAALSYTETAACMAKQLRRDPDVLDVAVSEEARSDYPFLSLPVLHLTLRRNDNRESQSVVRFFEPHDFLPGLRPGQQGYAVDATDRHPRMLRDGNIRTYGVRYRHTPPVLMLQDVMARDCRAMNVASLPMFRASRVYVQTQRAEFTFPRGVDDEGMHVIQPYGVILHPAINQAMPALPQE